MRSFFKNNFIPLGLFTLALFIALFFIYSYDKNNIHIYLNQFVGNLFINATFYYITFLGDGTVAVVMLAIILFLNVRLGLYSTASFLAASLISIGLKYFFFDDVNRPSFIFQYIHPYPLKVVEGVQLNIHNSFPSGHATQAFAILMCVCFTSSSRAVKIFLFMIALMTAFSRVYLSQHWLEDITAGSFIGMFCSILFYFVFIHNNRFPKLNRRLSDFRKA